MLDDVGERRAVARQQERDLEARRRLGVRGRRERKQENGYWKRQSAPTVVAVMSVLGSTWPPMLG